MAKKPGKEGGARYGPKPPADNWHRSGGAFGDPSMAEMDDYNLDGAGVHMNIKGVGMDPNEGVSLGPKREGSEE